MFLFSGCPFSLPGVEVVDDGPHQVLERIGRGKVEANLGGLLSDARTDFQQAQLDRVEVGWAHPVPCMPISLSACKST